MGTFLLDSFSIDHTGESASGQENESERNVPIDSLCAKAQETNADEVAAAPAETYLVYSEGSGRPVNITGSNGVFYDGSGNRFYENGGGVFSDEDGSFSDDYDATYQISEING